MSAESNSQLSRHKGVLSQKDLFVSSHSMEIGMLCSFLLVEHELDDPYVQLISQVVYIVIRYWNFATKRLLQDIVLHLE